MQGGYGCNVIGYSYVKWIQSEAKQIRSADMYELIKQKYFYAGQYSFDDFMIAMVCIL